MRELIVSNSTSLIAFGNSKRLDILQNVYGSIYVPDKVFQEVKSVTLPSWVKVVPIKSKRSYETLTNEFSLDPGEAETLVLAEELGREPKTIVKAILLDENMARSYAKKLFTSNYPQLHSVLHTIRISTKKGYIADENAIRDLVFKNGYKPNNEDKIKYSLSRRMG